MVIMVIGDVFQCLRVNDCAKTGRRALCAVIDEQQLWQPWIFWSSIQGLDLHKQQLIHLHGYNGYW